LRDADYLDLVGAQIAEGVAAYKSDQNMRLAAGGRQ
jgi:hypothetical protein